MRPADIAKEIRLEARPCLFNGNANPSDVCQVQSILLLENEVFLCLASSIRTLFLTEIGSIG